MITLESNNSTPFSSTNGTCQKLNLGLMKESYEVYQLELSQSPRGQRLPRLSLSQRIPHLSYKRMFLPYVYTSCQINYHTQTNHISSSHLSSSLWERRSFETLILDFVQSQPGFQLIYDRNMEAKTADQDIFRSFFESLKKLLEAEMCCFRIPQKTRETPCIQIVWLVL